MYSMSDQERDGVLAAPHDKQYAYFLNKAADEGEVWSLSDGERLGSLDEDGESYFPVWPHPDFVEASIEDDDNWSSGGFKPRPIEVHSFLDFLETLENDGTKVAILASPKTGYLTMPPGPLGVDLQAALDQVE